MDENDEEIEIDEDDDDEDFTDEDAEMENAEDDEGEAEDEEEGEITLDLSRESKSLVAHQGMDYRLKLQEEMTFEQVSTGCPFFSFDLTSPPSPSLALPFFYYSLLTFAARDPQKFFKQRFEIEAE